MKNSAPKPKSPPGLSAEARHWWRRIQIDYAITDPGGLFVLRAAVEAFERMLQAQTILAAEGLTTVDRFGQSRAHPAVIIERDSRGSMLAAIKQLGLDLEPLHDRPGRPAGK